MKKTKTNKPEDTYSSPPSFIDYHCRWRGEFQNLQYSNCSCPVRTADIMRQKGGRKNNLCETNNPCLAKNNPDCDCFINKAGKADCDCEPKSCGPGGDNVLLLKLRFINRRNGGLRMSSLYHAMTWSL